MTGRVEAVDGEQEALILEGVERFLDHDVRPHVSALEHGDVYPEDIVEKMKEMGLFGATISEEFGGLGLPATTYAKIIERLSHTWMSVSGIINSHLIMAAAVERFGTDEQRRDYLPRFASGELRGGLALTEPDCGTDLQAIQTTARRDGNRSYVVNGAKTWITNSIHGSCVALLAKTDPDAEPRHKGMSLFLAEKGEGFRVSRKLEKLGYKGIDTAELAFEDYRIGADRLIGGVEGKGLQHALGGLELGRINVAARGVGVAQSCLDEAVRYAQERKTFGKPICQHQAIQIKLADMVTRTEGRAPAYRPRGDRLRDRPALRHGSRHGQAVRDGGGAREQHRGDADPRRLRLLEGISHRADVPRRPAALHRRGHERNPAAHHRAPTDRAQSGVSGHPVPTAVAPIRPLEGLTVLAIEQYGAAPFGTMYLADLGAEVIKIENHETGGEMGRHVLPYAEDGDSLFHQTFSCNKRGLALNLKRPRGREILERLTGRADALINNLRGRPAGQARAGLCESRRGQSAHRLRSPLGLWPRQ